MHRKVIWSPSAENDFAEILNYLSLQWDNKIVNSFIDRLDNYIVIIDHNPKYFPLIDKKLNIRKCVITKQNSLFYRASKNKIEEWATGLLKSSENPNFAKYLKKTKGFWLGPVKIEEKVNDILRTLKILKAKYDYEVHNRTLQRWMYNLDYNDNWDLKDKSKRPKKIHYKVSNKDKSKIIKIRKKTGWGEEKIASLVEVSHWSVNKVLAKHNLLGKSKRKKKRIKYIRWQRKHPNSLWQIDHRDQKVEGKWVILVVDDCSRKSLAFVTVNRVTTDCVMKIIDDLSKVYCYPKQILTDNGSAYGLKSKQSRFDRKCRKRGIHHIRSAIHSPTTCGKVERLFQTFKREIKFYNNDPELFRMRYNHFRPHTSLNGKTPDEVYNDFRLLF